MIYSKTNLIRGFGERLGEYFPSTPDTLGTTTTLIDASLDQYLPGDLTKLNCWVYGAEGVAAANARVERRGKTWTQGTHTLAFYSAWPTAITAAGTYEIHTRYKRSQLAEAINSALRQLGVYWYRSFVDTTLTTVTSTLRYTLPSDQAITKIERVEIENNTANATYPYVSAARWGWDLRRSVDDGEETIYLQFSSQPPAPRKLRIYGEGYFPDLTNDSDTIDMAGQWAGIALEWIYDWATYRVNNWTGNRANQGDVDKYRVKELQSLMETRQMVQDLIKPRTGGRVIAPNMGGSGRDNWRYMGALRSDAVV